VSDYRTVAVDVEDRSSVPDDMRIADLASYWGRLEGSTLVFVSAPGRAERTAIEVAQFDAMQEPTAFAGEVAEWLADNFHAAWRIVEALRGGVGTHTGPMPSRSSEVGFDGIGISVLDFKNDGGPVSIVYAAPAPQPGDSFHYGNMIIRMANEYDTTFGHI
jgi:hypothetical protein